MRGDGKDWRKRERDAISNPLKVNDMHLKHTIASTMYYKVSGRDFH